MAYICTKFYTGTKNHTPQAILSSKFNSRKIQDDGGRHFEIHFNGHNSVTITHICTKFGTETKNNVPEKELTSYLTSKKIQDGGGHHFENWFNGYTSVAMAYICIKFYTGTKNHTPQSILMSKFNSRKIQDGGGRHFEIHINGNNSVIIERIRTKFGTETKKTSGKQFYLQISLLRNAKMAAAAILKIGLMAISRSLWHIFERNFTQTQTLYWCVVFFLFNCMLVLFSHFGYNEINIHTYIHTYTGTKNHTPQAILPSKFNFHKIQDGGGRHFEILFNGHNSVTVQHIRTKFDKETRNNVQKSFTLRFHF